MNQSAIKDEEVVRIATAVRDTARVCRKIMTAEAVKLGLTDRNHWLFTMRVTNLLFMSHYKNISVPLPQSERERSDE